MPNPISPTTPLAEETEDGPQPGVGLSVSGGGYRAMLFHLGSFLRLFELRILQRLDRVSSVSGGSITVAKIGLEWHRIGSRDDFMTHVVQPLRALASITVDQSSVIGGLLLPGSAADRVAAVYRRHLFGDKTLQDLPDAPRFVINATNVETGTLWRFSKPYMRDYRVGKVANPEVKLADAVTASSAFPPILSPFVLDVDPDSFTEVQPGLDRRFLEEISLTDGGVYDNLGLETVWKRLRTVLVSDAGGKIPQDATPASDWARHSLRVLEIIHEQVSSVRKRQVIASYKLPAESDEHRSGAYWGIRTDISHYGVENPLPAPRDHTLALAETPTRLKRLSGEQQEKLINWGYAVCDAAIRKHWPPPEEGPERAFPYPGTGV